MRYGTRASLTAALTLLAAWVLPAGLAGCGDALSKPAAPASGTAAARVKGTVYGGQQPIVGAGIQLYAANLTTLRGASRAMLTAAVTTGSGGGFDITGLYTCAPGDFVYLVAAGGDAGAGTNPAIVQMAALGACSALSQATFINLTEVTTVASVYALAPFMADVQHVGAPARLLTGLQNAFAMESVLADNRTGLAAAGTPNRSVPVAELYTLADILAACINSAAASSACSQLMADATTASRGVPSDTVAAALGIAAAPAANVSALAALATPISPFQPVLPSAPADWSISVTLTGGGLKGPRGIALDANGSAWVANGAGSSLSEFSASGTAMSGAGGYTGGGLQGPQAVAIDPSGNLWVANTGGNSVVKLSSAGAVLSGPSGYTGGGISTPVDLASDTSGNIWVANVTGDSVTELMNSGVASGSSPLTLSGNVVRPTAIAISPTGDVWVASSGTGTLVSFTSGGALNTAGATDNWLQGTGMLAVDPAGTAWVTAPGIGAVTAIGAGYTAATFSPSYNSAAALPVALAIDGAGNIWVADAASHGKLSELLATTGAAASGKTAIGSLSEALGVATDASGNVWVTNSGNHSVTVMVGLAVPAVTPIVGRSP